MRKEVLPAFSIAFAFLVFSAAGWYARADTYSENFDRPDGPPQDWVIVRPSVTVESGQLVLAPAGAGEVDVFAGQGGMGLWFENVTRIAFDISYPGDPTSWPFDHGGVIFCAQSTNGRYGTTCYTVDYLSKDPNTPQVGRFRLGKFLNGKEIPLTQTDVNITEYEGRWVIELTETTISFYFNDELQFSFEDTDIPRSGFIGFWAYQAPAENRVAIDNLEVEHTPGPCPAFLSDSVVMTFGKENALIPIRIPIDANAAEPYEVTVSSADPGTAAPAAEKIVFETGGPLFKNAEIQPVSPGQTLLSLSVPGEECPGAVAMAEVLAPVAYEEDFTQPDGPPEGWYIASQTAEVVDGVLSLHAPGQPFVWYGIGGEAVNVPKIDAIRFKIKFAKAALPVGAHGGMILAPQPGTARGKGYMIDVIERESDNGFRIYKDNQPEPGLVTPRPPYVWDDQWHTWEIVFTPTGFTFSVDGTMLAEVNDLTYRGGYLAFWCYTGAAGQNMFVDDIRIEFGASACPSISPKEAVNRPVNPPTVFTVTAPFGANRNGDYHPTVTSSDPSVAVPIDPDTGEPTDGSLVLSFPQGEGVVSTTFEVACLRPGTTELSVDTGDTSCLVSTATFTVREPGEPGFCDDFSAQDGPPENWTAYSGDWQVQDGVLTVTCPPGSAPNESWIWAFSPPKRIEGAQSIEFTIDLDQTTPDAVGRHGGFMFFADAPTWRWEMSGYEIDWIDRAEDHGYRFIRSDNGVHTLIAGPTGQDFELGRNWRVEIEETHIKFYVDGVLVFDVEDPTYREGYFGFWTYCNTTVASIDDVVVGTCGTLFKRGDANADGARDIADAVCVLGYLFGTPDDPCKAQVPLCFDAADANDDGGIDIADGISILSHLFGNSGPLPEPFESCGLDPSEDELGCESFGPCK